MHVSFRCNDKFVINIIHRYWSKSCRVCTDIKMNRAREKEEYVKGGKSDFINSLASRIEYVIRKFNKNWDFEMEDCVYIEMDETNNCL